MYDKLNVLNLRTRLDKFIFEEKEKTMMHQSDIPDAEASHLPKIEEINSSGNDDYHNTYNSYLDNQNYKVMKNGSYIVNI